MLKGEPVDLVVGSRYMAEGGIGGLYHARATTEHLRCKVEITDPMSGFFMLRRQTFDEALRRISDPGVQILLDILASSPQRCASGNSPTTSGSGGTARAKLDALLAWEYMMLIADKLIGHIVPVRFALFTQRPRRCRQRTRRSRRPISRTRSAVPSAESVSTGSVEGALAASAPYIAVMVPTCEVWWLAGVVVGSVWR